MKAEERSCEIPGRPTDTDLKQDEFIPVWPQGGGKAFAGKAFEIDRRCADGRSCRRSR